MESIHTPGPAEGSGLGLQTGRGLGEPADVVRRAGAGQADSRRHLRISGDALVLGDRDLLPLLGGQTALSALNTLFGLINTTL